MKKVIRITESELFRIVDQVLTEMPLGVPENITNTAEQIYSGLISQFSSNYDLSSSEIQGYEITLNGNFRVSDYNFNSVNIILNLSEYVNPDNPPQLLGASVGNRISVKGDQIHNDINDNVKIILKFAVGKNWNLGVLLDLLKSARPRIISILSHELLHQFENYKNPTSSASTKATYDSIQNLEINGVQPLNTFLHLLYFVHKTERYTRSSEMYGNLKANNITKEKFKEFFNESDLIKTLMRCRDYSFTKLVGEIRNHMDEVNEFLEELNERGAGIDMESPDSVKVNELLKFFHIILTNLTIKQYIDIIKSGIDPFQQFASLIFGVEDEDTAIAQQYINEFAKKIQKYKNYKDFFGNEIKRLNFVGDQTIKKLSKLYDMLETDKSSIVNWDLHHKINNTAEKTKMKLQELIHSIDTKINHGVDRKTDAKKKR